MPAFQLEPGEDVRVAVPNSHPGEVVTVHLPGQEHAAADRSDPFADDEREAFIERILRLAVNTRENRPVPWRTFDHGDLLYGDDARPGWRSTRPHSRHPMSQDRTTQEAGTGERPR